jgi:alginate O-acetyltransferase complex protein AlgI
MSFTSVDCAVFLAFVFSLYWAMPLQRGRNAILLVASYGFYGYIHPWFCLLIASSTFVALFPQLVAGPPLEASDR